MGDDERLMGHCKVLIFTLGEMEPLGGGLTKRVSGVPIFLKLIL